MSNPTDLGTPRPDEHPVRGPAHSTRRPSAVEIAGTLGSPLLEAVNAFEARWNLLPGHARLQLWEPEASSDTASIGIARRGASNTSVVRVSLQGDNSVRMSTLGRGTSLLDFLAASRALKLPLDEIAEMYMAAAGALREMRIVRRLADELYSARNRASTLERTLDREARATGDDAAWLKSPQAQRAEVTTWKAIRDRFTAEHGQAGVIPTGPAERSDLTMEISNLVMEQFDLWPGTIRAWASPSPAPSRPGVSIAHALTVLPRVARNVAARIARLRELDTAVHIAEERRRIADGLEVATERLHSAEALQAAHADVDRLHDVLIGAVTIAAKPVPTPNRPTSYTGRAAPGTSSRPRRQGPALAAPEPLAPRLDADPPSL